MFLDISAVTHFIFFYFSKCRQPHFVLVFSLHSRTYTLGGLFRLFLMRSETIMRKTVIKDEGEGSVKILWMSLLHPSEGDKL